MLFAEKGQHNKRSCISPDFVLIMLMLSTCICSKESIFRAKELLEQVGVIL